jgi:hypothetical protein
MVHLMASGEMEMGTHNRPERLVRALCGEVLAHRVPGDALHMATVAAEDGDAGGSAAAADVPDDDGVVDGAGSEPAVTRAPRQVKHVAVMLPQRVRAPITTTTTSHMCCCRHPDAFSGKSDE